MAHPRPPLATHHRQHTLHGAMTSLADKRRGEPTQQQQVQTVAAMKEEEAMLPRFSDIEAGRVAVVAISTAAPPPAYLEVFTESGHELELIADAKPALAPAPAPAPAHRPVSPPRAREARSRSRSQHPSPQGRKLPHEHYPHHQKQQQPLHQVSSVYSLRDNYLQAERERHRYLEAFHMRQPRRDCSPPDRQEQVAREVPKTIQRSQSHTPMKRIPRTRTRSEMQPQDPDPDQNEEHDHDHERRHREERRRQRPRAVSSSPLLRKAFSSESSPPRAATADHGRNLHLTIELPPPELWIQWTGGSLGMTFRRSSQYIVLSRLTGAGCSHGIENLRPGDRLRSFGSASVGSFATADLSLSKTMELIKTLPKPIDLCFVVQ